MTKMMNNYSYKIMKADRHTGERRSGIWCNYSEYTGLSLITVHVHQRWRGCRVKNEINKTQRWFIGCHSPRWYQIWSSWTGRDFKIQLMTNSELHKVIVCTIKCTVLYHGATVCSFHSESFKSRFYFWLNIITWYKILSQCSSLAWPFQVHFFCRKLEITT